MIILKVTKKQGFTLFLENSILEKLQGELNWPPTFLVLNDTSSLGAVLMILFRELNLPGFIHLGLAESNAGPSQEFQNKGHYLSFSFPVWRLVLLDDIVWS